MPRSPGGKVKKEMEKFRGPKEQKPMAVYSKNPNLAKSMKQSHKSSRGR